MNELVDPNEERLFQRVTDILTDSRDRVARTVNTEMVSAYWRIGREIFEIEQQGARPRSHQPAADASVLSGVSGGYVAGRQAAEFTREDWSHSV
jgi:hypothetical protein